MLSLFYGLFTKEEKGDNFRTRFAFLFEIKRESGDVGFELLSGLFGIDKKRVRIFFIPIERNAQTDQSEADN